MNKESPIERQVTKYAKDNDMFAVKMVSVNNAGLPDHMYLYNGVCFFIEYKKPGGRLRKLQNAKIALIRKQGFEVFVIDNVETGKDVINAIVEYVKNAQ